MASALPPFALTEASAFAAADAKAWLMAEEADWALAPQASAADFAQASARALAVATADAEPEAVVWQPEVPRTLTVTDASALATATETASAAVEACEMQGQVVHCANASLVALAKVFLDSPEATAVLEAEQSAVR